MDTVTLSDAQAQLSQLLDRVEAGEAIDITRHGKAVARLTSIAAPRKQVDLTMLQALTATLSPQSEPGANLIRSMRDGDRV